MKHSIIHILAIATLLSCSNQESNQQSLIEASRQELATAVSERDELLALVKEIATATNQVKHLENIMTLTGSQSKENPPSHSQILADIAAINQTLENRRKELAELEERLKKSSLFTDDLQSTIEALRTQIDSQTEEISHLRTQLSIANNRIWRLTDTVDSLNVTVAETSDELDASRNESLKLENELNACFYAIATKKELKEHRIIESGFLRKTKLMDGDFDKEFFIAEDKRTLKLIKLNSNKAKIYTNHPSDSYELITTDGQKMLKIKNPEEFWDLSDYLVIQID
ncbi:MAG: hypothetical protein NC248_09275 [Bacteroides sp.]|nr:hypothetical protein [Bacteroides sp.]MCM1390146.1 hypothetical protein [Bacteroides sp.]